MAGNSGGPWGGGSGGPKRPSNGNDGGRPPKNSNQGQMPPEIDDMLKKGQEQLRVLMGGGSKRGGRGSGNPGDGGICLLYTSPSPRDQVVSRMPSSA